MPRFNSEIALPVPNDSWTPEAMLTWMYERCMRRRANSTSASRSGLYDERLAVLREVMSAYRHGDAATREAAADMTREMHDLSEDENSPTAQLTLQDMNTVLRDAQRAYEVGSQVASLAAATNASGSSESAHVNAVANQLISMLSGDGMNENAEEEEQASSDELMEAQSERRRRYLNSEMCECSDPDEWMLYHHGGADSDESESP
eukprot:s3870_g3.t1